MLICGLVVSLELCLSVSDNNLIVTWNSCALPPQGNPHDVLCRKRLQFFRFSGL